MSTKDFRWICYWTIVGPVLVASPAVALGPVGWPKALAFVYALILASGWSVMLANVTVQAGYKVYRFARKKKAPEPVEGAA